MSKHDTNPNTVKHDAGNCEVCAAQYEAEAVGAIPTAGHALSGTMEHVVGNLAFAIYYGNESDLVSQADIRRLLVEFAEEVKRQAVEP